MWPARERPFVPVPERKAIGYTAFLRTAGGQLLAEQLSQGRAGHERQVQQVRFAWIIVFPRRVQQIECRLQACPGLFALAAACRGGRRNQLALKAAFVDAIHVANVDGDRLDHIMAIAQGQEIGYKIGIEHGRRKRGQSPFAGTARRVLRHEWRQSPFPPGAGRARRRSFPAGGAGRVSIVPPIARRGSASLPAKTARPWAG